MEKKIKCGDEKKRKERTREGNDGDGKKETSLKHKRGVKEI